MITLAFKEAGILGVGQSLLAEDVNDGFTLLQRMTSLWQKQRWLVPALIDIATIGNGQKSNTIGPGGYWNVPRPNDIKGGYVIQLGTGITTPVSLPLEKIFSYEDYIQISVKNLQTLPDHFFYDGAFVGGLGNVFIWPVPNSQYECHLLVEAQLGFPSPLGLDSLFSLPPEYQEAIHYNLAWRIGAMYQFPINPDTKSLAKNALNVIRVANTQVPRLTMPTGLKTGKAFNIFNADGY
jgi:hypothetical protein